MGTNPSSMPGRHVTSGANRSGTDGGGAFAAWRNATDESGIQPQCRQRRPGVPAMPGFFPRPSDRRQSQARRVPPHHQSVALYVDRHQCHDSTDLDNAPLTDSRPLRSIFNNQRHYCPSRAPDRARSGPRFCHHYCRNLRRARCRCCFRMYAGFARLHDAGNSIRSSRPDDC